MDAYDVKEFQVTGLPEWGQSKTTRSDLFDVDAIVSASDQEPGIPAEKLRLMLQRLLADRFQLQLHRDTRELSVYAMTRDKNPLKFQQVPPDREATEVPAGKFRGTMAYLLFTLPVWLDRPIVDRTGLDATATYEFTNLDLRQARAEREADPSILPSSIFVEVRDKWGLKLEARKEATDILVIDHVQKPSPN